MYSVLLLNGIYKNLFLKYACIGVFPRVVRKYIESQRIVDACRQLGSIVFDMKTDFGRRKDRNGEPVFKASEVSRIQNVYDLIPAFLARDNKRFIVSKVSGGYYARNDAAEYLRQAHIVSKVYNVSIPSLPLSGERIESQFKLFPEDIGIVTTMYGIDAVAALNRAREQSVNPWYSTVSLRRESSRTILQRKADPRWTLSFPTKLQPHFWKQRQRQVTRNPAEQY